MPIAATFNLNLSATLATVTIVHVSGIQNDGTPIIPIFFKEGPPISSKINDSGMEFETAVSDARAEVAAHRNALQNRWDCPVSVPWTGGPESLLHHPCKFEN